MATFQVMPYDLNKNFLSIKAPFKVVEEETHFKASFKWKVFHKTMKVNEFLLQYICCHYHNVQLNITLFLDFNFVLWNYVPLSRIELFLTCDIIKEDFFSIDYFFPIFIFID